MIQIDFDAWKAEYEPRIYEDSGAECFDHEECDCEFLYTYTLPELIDENWEDEDWMETKAIQEKRIWTWDNEGIRSGVTNERSELLITKKPWTEETEII